MAQVFPDRRKGKLFPVPVVVLVLVSATAGIAVWWAATAVLRTWWGRAPGTAVAAEIREHTRIRRFVHKRLDAEVLTGLALTIALGATVLAGVVVGLLALVIRTSRALSGADSAAARWARDHGSATTHRVLLDVTSLASTEWVAVIAVVVGAVELRRVPSRWIPVFLLVVIAGDSLVTNLVKELVDRARPTIDPAAAALGPSFPSGHSSTAAATFAALALLAGRRRPHAHKALLAGLAAGLAVAVAASRVLLDVHWLSDVVAGLALGWGWFALCAAAFGGWMLQFGAPVEAAAGAPAPAPASQSVRS
jgi:membrane-associated phospholipid phosphatase